MIPQSAMNAQKTEIMGKLAAFLDRFAHLKQQIEHEQLEVQEPSCARVGELLHRFETALPGLLESRKIWKQETAPDFNLFRVLRIERRETKLHSRFLAELLRPSGRHGQGDTFLKGFLLLCGMQRPEWLDDLSDWQVDTEVCFNPPTEDKTEESGRLDIVIRCTPRPGFIAVIENKVDAQEGQDQLKRYGDWLEAQRSDFHDRWLVFLTPEGRKAETSAAGRDYIRLSYRQGVATWLQRAKAEINAPRLLSVLDEYLEIIESL